jgi:rare lipoprotein A
MTHRHALTKLAGIALIAVVALLTGCASRGPVPTTPPQRDGPGANPPPDLASRPDAEPRVEPLRSGGPNKPYEVFGQRYVPLTGDVPLQEAGGASWYGRKFHGLPTASGEPYDMYAMTAAHKTMPIPSYALVRNPANGREVVVRVNDRGPFVAGRVIDLSYTAALKLDLLRGVAPVEVRRLTFAEIRAGRREGRWRRQAEAVVTAVAPANPATPAAATAAPPTGLPADDPAPGEMPTGTLWLQLGAFSSREPAQQLLQRALFEADTAVQLSQDDAAGVVRVHAGPFDSREQAQQAAARLRRALGIAPLLVERR